MKEIKDWRGTPIEVGDVILYAVKHSTFVEVNEAVVREVGYQAPSWMVEFHVHDNDKQPYVKVEWIKSSSGEWADKWRKIKMVTLIQIGNITVVEKHLLPAWSRKPELVQWSEPKVA